MLEVKQLEKRFGGITAIDGCSLQVERESITGLIGPNGAGKTTLFNLVTGFFRPQNGEIWFAGDRIDGLPPHEVFRRGLTRTFQIPRELKQMTVLENLMLVPKQQMGERIWNSWFRFDAVRAQEWEIRDRALEVLEFVDLIHLKDEYAKKLSVGQKKLLELARALMSDPKMILLDEPGAGVNPALMKRLTKYIEQLRSEGITFFLIEHDMDLITNLCDEVIVMSKGKELARGTPEEVKKDQKVLDAYLGA